jgi:CAAX protease family protein
VALLTPPVLILAVLLTFRTLVSPVFTPSLFLLGISFGIVPGFLEEVGWMGFAFPRMQGKRNALAASLLLGVLWGLWHAPVVDYLGAATPHGVYWVPFFLAFVAILTAMRVLIVWVYSNTGSLLLAQLMHVSSTASLVLLDPARVSPAQETLWYAVYAAVLWIVVALVAARYGKRLVRQPSLAGCPQNPSRARTMRFPIFLLSRVALCHQFFTRRTDFLPGRIARRGRSQMLSRRFSGIHANKPQATSTMMMW